MNAVKQWNNVMCFGCFCDLYHKNSTVRNTNHILRLQCHLIYAISLMIGPAMRSGRCTWRPSCRTTERLWRLRTLPRKSSPPLPVIRWVEQVSNKSHSDHVCHSILPLFEPLHHYMWAFSSSFIWPSHILQPFLHFLHICRSHLPPSHPSLPTFADEYQMRMIRLFPLSNRLQTRCCCCLHFLKVSLMLLFVCSCFKLLLSVQLLSLWI